MSASSLSPYANIPCPSHTVLSVPVRIATNLPFDDSSIVPLSFLPPQLASSSSDRRASPTPGHSYPNGDSRARSRTPPGTVVVTPHGQTRQGPTDPLERLMLIERSEMYFPGISR
jgi:hypothetical protein